MKKLLIILLLLVACMSSFAQILQPDAKTKAYYLTKSSHQRKTASIMLDGGAGLAAVGVVLTGVAIENNDKGRSANIGYVGVPMLYAGVLSALGSIPFFISAAHNKHKVAELSFNLQRTPILYSTGYRIAIRQPTIALHIPL